MKKKYTIPVLITVDRSKISYAVCENTGSGDGECNPSGFSATFCIDNGYNADSSACSGPGTAN